MVFFKKDRDMMADFYSQILNNIISHDRWKIILNLFKQESLTLKFKSSEIGNSDWIEDIITNIGVNMELSDLLVDRIKYTNFAGEIFKYKSNIDLLLKTSFQIKKIEGDFALNKVEEFFIGHIHIIDPIEYLMPTGKQRFHGRLLPFEKDPGELQTPMAIDSENQNNFLLLLNELNNLKNNLKPKKFSVIKSKELYIEEQLEKLKGLLNKGLISQKQYDAKSNKILDL